MSEPARPIPLAVNRARALRLAHRGDHRRAPENTLAALRAAMTVPGVDGVELDVRASADGLPVLLHDPTLARVFGRPERAAELPAAGLARLGVATLGEALAALPPDAFLDVELKEEVVAATLDVLRAARGDPPARVVLSSFWPAVLDRVAALAPAWPRWLNCDVVETETLGRARGLGCSGVSVEWHSLGGRAFERAADAGLDVAGWTVRRRSTAARLDRLGAVALCVEGPALVG